MYKTNKQIEKNKYYMNIIDLHSCLSMSFSSKTRSNSGNGWFFTIYDLWTLPNLPKWLDLATIEGFVNLTICHIQINESKESIGIHGMQLILVIQKNVSIYLRKSNDAIQAGLREAEKKTAIVCVCVFHATLCMYRSFLLYFTKLNCPN